MTRRRWLILAGLSVILIFIVAHALLPSPWYSQATLPGQVAKTVAYHCGASFRSSYVRGPTTPLVYVAGKPCGTREQLRIMSIVDIALAVIAIALVAGVGRGRIARRFASD